MSINSSSNKKKDISPQNHLTIDRYQHDLQQARALRSASSSSNNNNNNNTKRIVTESQVLLALDELERAETLHKNGNLEEALQTSETALGVMISYLKNPLGNNTSTINRISKDGKDTLLYFWLFILLFFGIFDNI